MTTETPPDDWVLLEAATRFTWKFMDMEELRNIYQKPKLFYEHGFRALCDMIETHEAFRQEVSDAVEIITNTAVDPVVWRKWVCDRLSVFIITKPDPLVDRKLICSREAMKSWVGGGAGPETICVRAIELWEEGFGE
jgi:hypothetical protein